MSAETSITRSETQNGGLAGAEFSTSSTSRNRFVRGAKLFGGIAAGLTGFAALSGCEEEITYNTYSAERATTGTTIIVDTENQTSGMVIYSMINEITIDFYRDGEFEIDIFNGSLNVFSQIYAFDLSGGNVTIGVEDLPEQIALSDLMVFVELKAGEHRNGREVFRSVDFGMPISTETVTKPAQENPEGGDN